MRERAESSDEDLMLAYASGDAASFDGLYARLKDAVTALPPAQRDAFLLQQEGGLTLEEIAALTGVGAETVKSRLRYATNKLRAELADLSPQLREDTG